MKGIILAGGSGTRLYPITKSVSKQLLPIYDKPMIYYPISTLMVAGIRDILIITTPSEIDNFKLLLGDGSKWGITLQYIIQKKPEGLAQAFILGEDFIGENKVALILGDNLFHGTNITKTLQENKEPDGGIIYAYKVSNPERYGVVEFDDDLNAISIEEKPERPKSNYVVPGLYFYDNNVIQIAKSLKPSKRGELEITDINNIYLENNKLKVVKLDRGTAWLDTGTVESLMHASQYIHVIEKRQGIKIGCPEEIAYKQGFINKVQLIEIATPLLNSGYGNYLLSLVN